MDNTVPGKTFYVLDPANEQVRVVTVTEKNGEAIATTLSAQAGTIIMVEDVRHTNMAGHGGGVPEDTTVLSEFEKIAALLATREDA